MTAAGPSGLHHRVVAAFDGSPSSIAAVRWAAREAALRGVALSVVAISKQADPESLSAAAQSASAAIAGVSVPQLEIDATSVRVSDAMLTWSDHAALLVVGADEDEHRVQVMSRSLPSRLLRHAHCPVAVVHADASPDDRSAVLVGVDGAPWSDSAVDFAFDEASRRGVDLVAVHAWTDLSAVGLPSINWSPVQWLDFRAQEQELLAERLAGHSERYPDVTVHSVVACDRTSLTLRRHARSTQLVVLGGRLAHSLSGMTHTAVTRLVLDQIHAPVVVVQEGPLPEAMRAGA